MHEGGERGCCVLQFIKRLIKADFDGQASRRAVVLLSAHSGVTIFARSLGVTRYAPS